MQIRQHRAAGMHTRPRWQNWQGKKSCYEIMTASWPSHPGRKVSELLRQLYGHYQEGWPSFKKIICHLLYQIIKVFQQKDSISSIVYTNIFILGYWPYFYVMLWHDTSCSLKTNHHLRILERSILDELFIYLCPGLMGVKVIKVFNDTDLFPNPESIRAVMRNSKPSVFIEYKLTWRSERKNSQLLPQQNCFQENKVMVTCCPYSLSCHIPKEM